MRANLLLAGVIIFVLASATSATWPDGDSGYRGFDNFNKRTVLVQFRHPMFNPAAVAAGLPLEEAQTSDGALERTLESAGVQHVEAVFSDFPTSALVHGRTARLPDFSNCYVFVVPSADAVAPLVTQLRSHPLVIAAESNDLILEPASEPNDPFVLLLQSGNDAMVADREPRRFQCPYQHCPGLDRRRFLRSCGHHNWPAGHWRMA